MTFAPWSKPAPGGPTKTWLASATAAAGAAKAASERSGRVGRRGGLARRCFEQLSLRRIAESNVAHGVRQSAACFVDDLDDAQQQALADLQKLRVFRGLEHGHDFQVHRRIGQTDQAHADAVLCYQRTLAQHALDAPQNLTHLLRR